MSLRDTANLLKTQQKEFMGPNKFVDWLRDRGYICKEDNANAPIAQYVERGFFEVIFVEKNDALRQQTVVTPKALCSSQANWQPNMPPS